MSEHPAARLVREERERVEREVHASSEVIERYLQKISYEQESREQKAKYILELREAEKQLRNLFLREGGNGGNREA